MSEWWTYRPDSFLMFAPRTYWRLFELHNEVWWPAALLWGLAGMAGLWGLARGSARAWRVGMLGLAAAWAGVAVSFHLQRYAPVNWAAVGLAWTFGAVSVALLLLGWRTGPVAPASGAGRRIALGLCAFALALHPLLAPLSGRAWAQAELFGLAPDPTVFATLGWMLAGRPASTSPWWLQGLWRAALLLALACCAISAATLATMGSAQWTVPAAALVLALLGAWAPRAHIAA